MKPTVAQEYAHLADGERRSGQMCPECGGGSSKERSLLVRREHGKLWYKCFRASCGFKGVALVGAVRSAPVNKPTEPMTYAPVITGDIPDNILNEIITKYNLDEGMIEWARWKYTHQYRGFGPRVEMPIFDPNHVRRGASWRSFAGYQPKALISKGADEEMMCWYRPKKRGRVLVIVEDQISALRITSQLIDSIALCGTTFNIQRLNEIKKENYERVYLCLDEDATAGAIRYGAMYRARLPSLVIKRLYKDVKNMSAEDFQVFIDSISIP